MAAIERGLAFFVPAMAAAAFAALKLLTQFGNLQKKKRIKGETNVQEKRNKSRRDADLFELIGAPAGGRSFVRAPPPLICPGPGGLKRMDNSVIFWGKSPTTCMSYRGDSFKTSPPRSPAWPCPSCRERVVAGCRPEARDLSGERQRARPARATAGRDGGRRGGERGAGALRGRRRETAGKLGGLRPRVKSGETQTNKPVGQQ